MIKVDDLQSKSDKINELLSQLELDKMHKSIKKPKRKSNTCTGFIKIHNVPVRFKQFYNNYLKDNELFQYKFSNFNIDEEHTKVTLLNIIKFYIDNISSSYTIKYFMLTIKCDKLTRRYFKHPRYYHTCGTIRINDDDIKFCMSKKLYSKTPHIVSAIEFVPDDTLIDIYNSVDFPSANNRYLILEQNTLFSLAADETIGFRIGKIRNMDTDKALIELFDIKEEEIITFRNFNSIFTRLFI